jgi:hypothetical protein
LELAKRVNEYQGRMRAVTRKVMAIVSELSMYQATSLKLGAEKDDLEATVSDITPRATWAIDKGARGASGLISIMI